MSAATEANYRPGTTISAIPSATIGTPFNAPAQAELNASVYSFPASIDPQALFQELYPLNRSITGAGYRRSLEILQRYIPFTIHSYKSGTQVCDWVVPQEWHVTKAQLKNSKGEVILDGMVNPLNLVSYSIGFQGKVSRDELEKHLFYDKRTPQVVPYTTSYYKDRWGFCLSYEQYLDLTDEEYEVDIVAHKADGEVLVGIAELPGKSDRLVQISAYLCHPNMFNNELSGPIAQVYLYHLLRALPEREYTYRFVINPETIGSICYMSDHLAELKQRLEYGIVLTCCASYYRQGPRNLRIAPLSLQELNALSQQGMVVSDVSKQTNIAQNVVRVQGEAGDAPGAVPWATTSTGTATRRDTTAVTNEANVTGTASAVSAATTAQTQAYQVYLDLIKQLKDGITGDFIDVPLSFKKTHQSMIDELKELRQARLNGTLRPDICAAKPGTEVTAATWTVQSQAPISYNQVQELSDKERLERANWAIKEQDRSFSIAVNELEQLIPPGQEYSFNYSFQIDQFLGELYSLDREHIHLRRYSPQEGSDERQYGAALANLPIVQATRIEYGTYGQYHSSGDNPELFSLESVIDSAYRLLQTCVLYERQQQCFKATVVGEPQLGKRGLYPNINSPSVSQERRRGYTSFSTLNLLMILSLATGDFNMADLSHFTHNSPFTILEHVELLEHAGLLTAVDTNNREQR